MLQKSKNSLIKLIFPSKKKKGLSHPKNLGEPPQFSLLHHRIQPAYLCRNPKVDHVISSKVLYIQHQAQVAIPQFNLLSPATQLF